MVDQTQAGEERLVEAVQQVAENHEQRQEQGEGGREFIVHKWQ